MTESVLALVVPCYNEADRLPTELMLEWAARKPEWQWLFVDDGSQDGTAAVLTRLTAQAPNLSWQAMPRNAGKAEAVRFGLKHCLQQGARHWIGYLDADMATAPSEVERMLQRWGDTEAFMVTGCRLRRLGARVQRSHLRHYGGRLVASAISLLLNLPTYDTQCGAKIFRASRIAQVLEDEFSSRWLFDVELLARCRNLFGREALLNGVVEEPLLQWSDRPGTKLRPKDVLGIPGELWKLHRRYNG